MSDETMSDKRKQRHRSSPSISHTSLILFSSLRSSLIASSLILFSSPAAHAGAWTQAEGRGQVIATTQHYRADKRIDALGDTVSQPRYRKSEVNLYGEYGLWADTTVGASLFLQHLNDNTDTTFGLGDIQLFARQSVWQSGPYVVSVQPEITLPSPSHDSSDRPVIGSAHWAAALRVNGGMSFSALGRTHYADVSAGYRYRDGAPQDQALLDATLGLRLTERFTLMPQAFGTLRTRARAGSGFTQSPGDDYSLLQVQVSGLYDITDTQALQLGLYTQPAGRNTGKGNGIFVAYWRKF